MASDSAYCHVLFRELNTSETYMRLQRLTKLLTFVLISVWLSGCSWFEVYQPKVQQGNILEEDTVNQLRTGMTREQVIYLIGTPLLPDPLATDRWDYVYQVRQGHRLLERHGVSLWFNGNTLTRIQHLEDDQQQKNVQSDQNTAS